MTLTEALFIIESNKIALIQDGINPSLQTKKRILEAIDTVLKAVPEMVDKLEQIQKLIHIGIIVFEGDGELNESIDKILKSFK